MKVLVTGAAGFIGSAVAIKLLERGDTVVGLDNLNEYYSKELKEARLLRVQEFEAFTFYKQDITEANPMKDEDANLRCINTLQEKFSCKVGYSGHESGVAISIIAAALGASSIERHITLDRAMYGSDQAASLEPAGLRSMVGAVRKAGVCLGDGEKRFLDVEKPVAEKLRAHIKMEKS